jgi:transposase-like protein
MTLNEIKLAIATTPLDNRGKRMFEEALKKEVISMHYTLNIPMEQYSKMINVASTVLGTWKRNYGKEATAYRFGKGVRYDVRTKALAVQMYMEEAVTYMDVALKFNSSMMAVKRWVDTYKTNYKELLDLPDGVPYLVDSSKHIYGDKNIADLLATLAKQEQELNNQLSVVQSKKKSILAAVELLQAEGVKVA